MAETTEQRIARSYKTIVDVEVTCRLCGLKETLKIREVSSNWLRAQSHSCESCNHLLYGLKSYGKYIIKKIFHIKKLWRTLWRKNG